MQLIAPEIIAEARGLTEAMAGTLCVLGAALWLFGWRWHRFWIVSGITLASGLCGLNAGRAAGGPQILAVGVLLAVAGGMLALELAKIFAFVAAGCGAWLAAQWVFPQAQELWAVFLSGGLFGLVLYRLWTMLLTSLAGVLLTGHSALLLLEPLLQFDAGDWVNTHQAAVNGGVVGIGVLGILLQAVASPGDPEAEEGEATKQKSEAKPEQKPEAKPESEAGPTLRLPWWRKLVPVRRAA